MIPMMMLALGGRREVVTQTFTANTTWPAPAGATAITTLSGKGANGTPSGTTTYDQQRTTVTTQYFRRDGGLDTVKESYDGWPSPSPSEYCDPQHEYTMEESSVYSVSVTCYRFDTYPKTISTPATTGASATGFGKTFPGGAGGPAAPVTFANVPLTPGANYPLVIPAGGSITITYLK